MYSLRLYVALRFLAFRSDLARRCNRSFTGNSFRSFSSTTSEKIFRARLASRRYVTVPWQSLLGSLREVKRVLP